VCVASAKITGVTNGSTVDENTEISCAADGNATAYPPAQYRWRNDVDGSQSAGPRFTLKPGTQYKLTCTASNNFNRQGCFATDYVEFNSKLPFSCVNS